jgi:hypothetical protein
MALRIARLVMMAALSPAKWRTRRASSQAACRMPASRRAEKNRRSSTYRQQVMACRTAQ